MSKPMLASFRQPFGDLSDPRVHGRWDHRLLDQYSLRSEAPIDVLELRVLIGEEIDSCGIEDVDAQKEQRG